MIKSLRQIYKNNCDWHKQKAHEKFEAALHVRSTNNECANDSKKEDNDQNSAAVLKFVWFTSASAFFLQRVDKKKCKDSQATKLALSAFMFFMHVFDAEAVA